MGNSITNLRQYLDEEDNVLVTIITDGYENASIEWNHERIFKLVNHGTGTCFNRVTIVWLFFLCNKLEDGRRKREEGRYDHRHNVI
jgi:hypothetical protein